jgi:hypothetical protein
MPDAGGGSLSASAPALIPDGDDAILFVPWREYDFAQRHALPLTGVTTPKPYRSQILRAPFDVKSVAIHTESQVRGVTIRKAGNPFERCTRVIEGTPRRFELQQGDVFELDRYDYTSGNLALVLSPSCDLARLPVDIHDFALIDWQTTNLGKIAVGGDFLLIATLTRYVQAPRVAGIRFRAGVVAAALNTGATADVTITSTALHRQPNVIPPGLDSSQGIEQLALVADALAGSALTVVKDGTTYSQLTATDARILKCVIACSDSQDDFSMVAGFIAPS